MSGRPKTAPGLAPAEWHGYALDCEERIAQLKAALYRIRDFNNEVPGPAMQDIARKALEPDE